ncbi:PREDICTED: uncharacterized protein LOC108747039 isoform X2 [Trachymyrmex septentrionalis]|uniref:uncharacterized protein LOC108747039 isoform X2 n=1 Tax=Trachymyrmex septentrionalis TaxID=34720 RepID=UPI00084EFA66|nr:PREDICTED: uncharacterized protein LOC108747039 isoform X2 [Trachymyrmex septentrionalis]
MSEKKTESWQCNEKLKKEQDTKTIEQFKTLMEGTKKKVEEITEKLKTETSQSIKSMSKISTSNKPEDSKDTETCQISKTMTELSISSKPDNSEAIEEEFQMSKSFTFMQPETSKVCQKPITTSNTSSKTDRKFPEVCEMPKIASKTWTSDKAEYCKLPEMHKIASKESKLEASEIPKARMFQMPKITSEGSIEFETPEIPKAAKIFQMPEMLKTTSEGSIEIKAPEIPEAAKVCQIRKTTSEESTKLETPEIPQVAKVCLMPKNKTEEFNRIISKSFKDPNVEEMYQMPESSQEVQTTSEPFISNKTKEAEMSKEGLTRNTKIMIYGNTECNCSKCISIPVSIPITSDEMEEKLLIHSKSVDDESTTDDEHTSISSSLTDDYKLDEKEKDDLTKFLKLEENQLKESFFKEDSTKSADGTGKTVMIPVIEKVELTRDVIKARKFWPPMSTPNFEEHHLVLATHHLVPSLPIGLFEMFAEMIEVVTKKPVVLLHECRSNRSIATEVVDIVILPAAETWKDGVLLPASFVFDHRLNKDKSASMYADVIVAKDRASHIQNIMDLRGYRCSIQNERHQFSASGLLLNYLQRKGENMIFFDASTQLEVLEMVAGKQAEAGILESSALRCNKYNVPGVDSLHILTSLGPMPPYRIMIKNTLVDELAEKLTAYLLNIDKYEEWLERLSPYGIIGFAKNSMDYYNMIDKKCVDTKVPYY